MAVHGPFLGPRIPTRCAYEIVRKAISSLATILESTVWQSIKTLRAHRVHYCLMFTLRVQLTISNKPGAIMPTTTTERQILHAAGQALGHAILGTLGYERPAEAGAPLQVELLTRESSARHQEQKPAGRRQHR